jgi:hypothetical protein
MLLQCQGLYSLDQLLQLSLAQFIGGAQQVGNLGLAQHGLEFFGDAPGFDEEAFGRFEVNQFGET